MREKLRIFVSASALAHNLANTQFVEPGLHRARDVETRALPTAWC